MFISILSKILTRSIQGFKSYNEETHDVEFPTLTLIIWSDTTTGTWNQNSNFLFSILNPDELGYDFIKCEDHPFEFTIEKFGNIGEVCSGTFHGTLCSETNQDILLNVENGEFKITRIDDLTL